MINFAELLWKPGQTGEKSRKTTAAVIDPLEVRGAPALELAPIDVVQLPAGGRLAQLTDSHSASADRFRFLRMRLRELRDLAKLRSMAVTSPLPGDGKSTVTTSLATALAEGGKHPTLLIDGDLHHSSVAKSLGIPLRSGLAECLQDNVDPMSEIRRLEPFGFHLLQAGEARGNPTELLQSAALSAVMQRLAPHFDWIVADTPPILPLTDALSLSRQVDATLIVARADRTSRDAIEETIKLIGQKYVLGIVLNGAEGLDRQYSRYYGHYKK
jgi:succinoglycan biosynthesis transport protein ExoP